MPTKKQSKNHSFVTYLSPKQFTKALMLHKSSVRGYCYIHHDKDENEPHYHLLVKTYSCWSPEQILKWFSGYVDDKGELVNTLCELIGSVDAMVDYIQHKDKKSIEEGKHIYDISEVVDCGFLSLVEKHNACDNTFEIINAMLSGMTLKDLVRIYGREFVYHYSQFSAIVDEMRFNTYNKYCKEPEENSYSSGELENIELEDILK